MAASSKPLWRLAFCLAVLLHLPLTLATPIPVFPLAGIPAPPLPPASPPAPNIHHTDPLDRRATEADLQHYAYEHDGRARIRPSDEPFMRHHPRPAVFRSWLKRDAHEQAVHDAHTRVEGHNPARPRPQPRFPYKLAGIDRI